MKIELFENKYKTSSGLKVFFADLVCFLLVAIISIGFCYSYFSDQIEVAGSTSTATITVDYRTTANNPATSVSAIYGSINGGATKQLTEDILVSPGDTLTVKGYAVNTSNVGVYVLARLEVVSNDGVSATDETDVVWYNIANNTQVTIDANGRYNVGASILTESGIGAYYKELSLPYVFDGEKYTNTHTITSLKLTLHVHQKDYLDLADDYAYYTAKYDSDEDGYYNGYEISSMYAVHYIRGPRLES